VDDQKINHLSVKHGLYATRTRMKWSHHLGYNYCKLKQKPTILS